VDPVLSVITDISLDHQRFLGDTVAAIAQEKAGIIRPHGIVVTLPQLPPANDAIGNAVLGCGARAVSAVPYVPPVSPASQRYFEAGHRDPGKTSALEEGIVLPQESGTLGLRTRDANPAERSTAPPVARYSLQFMGEQILVETPLIGRHQLRNIALAIASADELTKQGFPITAGSVERGIRQTRWPARFQVIPATAGAPEYVLDVAHNPAGVWALRSTLSACYEGRWLTLVFGAMRDKAIGEMAEILFPLADRVIATQAENPRSATPEEIRQLASRVSVDVDQASSLSVALARAGSVTPRDGIIVVTGSIYIVGGAMRILGLRI
jgi:dihydrofolate synthase / folylpolyglutamate synthase